MPILETLFGVFNIYNILKIDIPSTIIKYIEFSKSGPNVESEFSAYQDFQIIENVI